MQNILIPTDFSKNAVKAARYALKVFGNKANYTLLNTYEVPHSGATMLITIADILEKDSLQLLQEAKAGLAKDFPELEGKIEILAKMGAPDNVIEKLTDRDDYDMVVMGTQGATGLKGALVGSVASKTMESVKCPVIAVPESVEFKLPRKILYAADDKCLQEGAFPKELANLAQEFDSEVMVLNVIPEGEADHVGNSPENEREPISVFDNVKHSFHFVENKDVRYGIERFIQENQVDLLAMVTRRSDLISKLFGLSVTKQMMLDTSVPLVAFHNGTQDST
ncbi:MAG: universal stress protein [Flavobacteriales bacterium]|nr:universal stress protein [Flavobacteriales bacterium]